MNIHKIQSAFSPSSEISDPNFFAGRGDVIRASINALTTTGSFIVVLGLRGIGKSSMAKQIRLIAEGNKVLLKIHNFIVDSKYSNPDDNKSYDFNYLTLYYSCDAFMNNVLDLVKRIYSGDDNNEPLMSLTKQGNRELTKTTVTNNLKGGARILGVELSASGQEQLTYTQSLIDDIIIQFKKAIALIRKDNQDKEGLLIIIDEFDTLKDKRGFSSLVKSLSSDFVKFMVVGIASDVSELIQDHSSIGRQFKIIKIDKMSEHELWEIITKAERAVNKEIVFTDQSAELMVKQSDGFPYFIHLLGNEAMLHAHENKEKVIDTNTIITICKKISEGKLNTVYDDMYHKAVGNSRDRELLLKLFADDPSNEIRTTTIYAQARDFGVANPSRLMKGLTTFKTDEIGVLSKIRESYYRFNDPVFKVYARIRSWKF